ncbi:DUF2829 domain-containing protein [Methylobacterium sp.]|uniref:DUF2829 domain-containing protein n=1 Tax=Methylobacterium sp. TaxID=409 RepID=UPI0025F17ADC|nr:DUF2829 domain-containing protein [Methylobacterium sp.]MBY0258795.1 DUF2829 domain-containing protein [Methylobacterium sp.]
MVDGTEQAKGFRRERDLDANPYRPDEQRAADALLRQLPDVGTGDDPLGFLVASWEQFVVDRKATRGLTFGQAIEQLKAGARVARDGWNGKGMWLSLSGPLPGREIAFENFWSSNNAEYARANGGSATVLPCITMKTATGEILMGWLASQTDMLAEDWCVV